MIIKIKLGDLTARQMKAICDSYDCKACPLKIIGKKKECFLNFFCSPNAVLETEIEVSTDLVCPNQSESFEEKIERLEKGLDKVWNKTQINKCTLSRLAKVLGYKVGELHRLGGWHQIYESDYRCPADGKETADGDEETGECEAFETEWNKIYFKLRDGELGNPTDPKTLIRYWGMMRDAHYPFAQDNLNALQKENENEFGEAVDGVGEPVEDLAGGISYKELMEERG